MGVKSFSSFTWRERFQASGRQNLPKPDPKASVWAAKSLRTEGGPITTILVHPKGDPRRNGLLTPWAAPWPGDGVPWGGGTGETQGLNFTPPWIHNQAYFYFVPFFTVVQRQQAMGCRAQDTKRSLWLLSITVGVSPCAPRVPPAPARLFPG